MDSSAVVTVAVGVAFALMGRISWSGRRIRRSARSIFGRPAIFFAGSGMFVFAGVARLTQDVAVVSTAASILSAISMLEVVWFAVVVPPAWARPKWQREGAG